MLGNKIKDILVGLVLAILPIVVSAQPRYIGEIGLRGGSSRRTKEGDLGLKGFLDFCSQKKL